VHLDENLRPIHCKCDRKILKYIQVARFPVTELTTVTFLATVEKVRKKYI